MVGGSTPKLTLIVRGTESVTSDGANHATSLDAACNASVEEISSSNQGNEMTYRMGRFCYLVKGQHPRSALGRMDKVLELSRSIVVPKTSHSRMILFIRIMDGRVEWQRRNGHRLGKRTSAT